MNSTPRRSKRSIPDPDTPEKVIQPVFHRQEDPVIAKGPHSSKVSNIVSWSSSDAKPMPEEGILRDFDLNLKFGPCCSLSRSERWLRAEALGLLPPTDILELIEKTKRDESVLDFHMRIQQCCN